MRVTLYSFFSQQDKRLNLFSPASDSGVKLYMYMAERMKDLGWAVKFIRPMVSQCAQEVYWPGTVVEAPWMPPDNMLRRVHWDTNWLMRIADTDLLLTQHSLLPIPVHAVKPELPVVLEVGMRPDQAWPWMASLLGIAKSLASMVHCNSEQLAKENPGSRVWKFGYDADVYTPGTNTGPVLFNARASSTGYTNHELFVDAARGWRFPTVMTDPTSYLRTKGGCEFVGEPYSECDYVELCRRSSVVVGLTENGYGGYAFMEAVAAGACPVALRLPEYEDLLTPDWPYLCSKAGIGQAVRDAYKYGWRGAKMAGEVRRRIAACSYQEAWKAAEADLCALMDVSKHQLQ